MEDHLPETLKPFFYRATEAQERLAKLEAALASSTKTDSQLMDTITQIQSELEESKETVKQQQKKVKELTIENEKQRYRINHLVQQLKAADYK